MPKARTMLEEIGRRNVLDGRARHTRSRKAGFGKPAEKSTANLAKPSRKNCRISPALHFAPGRLGESVRGPSR